ncbi:MAG: succinyl-diaminopimelate desuccinylase [Candidatus Dojkabacteria bacterium]|nr:MAG: succinyl-diaminopimelate desuccinylase [Candidatus Dojkabacteria bacterium]
MKNKYQKYLDELIELLKIPSISSLPTHKKDTLKAAEFIIDELKKINFKTELFYSKKYGEENHYPVIFAEKISNPNNKTILIYGHYDVQPVDPLTEWLTDPFNPEIKEGKIYARGVNDNKGQLYTHIAALKELDKCWGDNWPVNVKIIFEGEEESGGETIEAFIDENKNNSLLKADVCLVSDTPWINKDTPAILTGLRGIVYTQIDVKAFDGDLHSGEFGGAVRNPANDLAFIISKLKDEISGKILIPNFYDNVKDFSSNERELLNSIPETEKQFLKNAKNAKSTFIESGYTFIEGKTVRPTLDVNGMWSGFTEEGAKTIIPATAHAKVSMRLVPNQDPEKIFELFKNYVLNIAPEGLDISVNLIHGGEWVSTSIDSDYVKIAQKAIKKVFKKEALFFKEGGSIPAIAKIQKALNVEPVFLGYGLPDDALHSPNEKFDLDQFFGGIDCNIEFFKLISKS